MSKMQNSECRLPILFLIFQKTNPPCFNTVQEISVSNHDKMHKYDFVGEKIKSLLTFFVIICNKTWSQIPVFKKTKNNDNKIKSSLTWILTLITYAIRISIARPSELSSDATSECFVDVHASPHASRHCTRMVHIRSRIARLYPSPIMWVVRAQAPLSSSPRACSLQVSFIHKKKI